MRQWTKWSAIVAAVGVGYLIWQCGSSMVIGGQLADHVVDEFHSSLNRADYTEIVENVDGGFLRETGKDELVKLLTGVHDKLGNVRTTRRTGMIVSAHANGVLIQTTYLTAFTSGDGVEAFVWRKSGDRLKLTWYRVEAKALLAR